MCPASWQPGDMAIKPDPEKSKEFFQVCKREARKKTDPFDVECKIKL